MRVCITYARVTEESLQDGDTSDNGFYTERGWHSLNGRTERNRQKTIRKAQCGRYDWTLRDALSAIADFQADCVFWCWNDEIQIHSERRQRDETDQYTEEYTVHIQGISAGTAERLYDLIVGQGVRGEMG